MASAASVSSNTTISPAPSLDSNTPEYNNGLARPMMRSNTNTKSADAGRKQSPGDGVPRRLNSQKAWGSASSSSSQRSSMAAQPNGNTPQPRNAGNMRQNTQKESGISDKQAHERLMFLLGAAIGLNVVITTKSGDKFEGLLSGSAFSQQNSRITLKMARKLQSATGGQVNGAASREATLVGSSPEYAMNFDLKDMMDMMIADFAVAEATKLANGSSTGFQTDADISGNQLRGERTLQRWVPEGPDSTDYSLESTTTSTGWDQFATNNQLFGTRSTYDENLYTTTIDRSAPSYKRREAEAARIAREIEGATSANVHVREERGQALENDGDDEEEKYSGVRRDERAFPPLPVGGPNKYTPPARRAPTGAATVPGAPVDPAIISASLSRPEGTKSVISNATEKGSSGGERASIPSVEKPSQTTSTESNSTTPTPAAESSKMATVGKKAISPGPTEDVEVKVLNQFRQFADSEKQRVIEKRRAQQNQDRTAKLNELLRFSKTFKLKTPIPSDLIGILAKDPAKQEAIVEKAQKEHEDSNSTAASPSPVAATSSVPRKVEPSQPAPPVHDRQTYNRGRGGFPHPGRPERPASQQPPMFSGRGSHGPYQQRFPAHQDRKGNHPPPIPAPIPIIEGRVPPTGPMAEQVGLTSPQRSNMHTPSSAVSGRFNLNVKASEFRPTAATFNPTGSHTPSSPASTHRAGSISRTASPSLFFGHRKPKPASERPSITKDFNPIARMKETTANPVKATEGEPKPEDAHKNHASNGGIPNAFQTGPRWTVKNDNDAKSYEEAFDELMASTFSRVPTRIGSAQHMPFPVPGGSIPNGPANVPHITTPQHAAHAPHQYSHQYDDGTHRLQFGNATPGVYPSPSIPSRQTSTYASPMPHPAQLSYQQQPFFGTPTQMPMQMRPFPGTPGMMHAQAGQMGAPMMVQQPSNGPYMAVPQQFNPQMQMYSPNASHVYPQQNGGYASPGRVAPMMMQQGSQQSHTGAPNMMFSVSNQGVPMGYPQQQMGVPRGNYGGHQYGGTPHQGYGMQHRTMSSGYGQIPQKMHPQMPPNHAPSMNGPPQAPAYGQMDAVQDDGK
ncbi:poly(A)-binding protein binding protein [Exophiala oligosperma]